MITKKISERTAILSLLLLFTFSSVYGQESKDILLWNATHKLTVNDFGIKVQQDEASSSFAQFTLNYQVNGFDFLTKNFNKKVGNYIIKSASWIDTINNTNQSLAYQQTLFDISEIYARRFRKGLKANRKKIAYGNKIVEELNNQIMTDFAKKRLEYDKETRFGTDEVKQKEWEVNIQKELAEFNDFSYEK